MSHLETPDAFESRNRSHSTGDSKCQGSKTSGTWNSTLIKAVRALFDDPEAQGKAEGENLCPSPPSSASSGQPNDSSYEELANDFDFHPCPGINASRLYLLSPDRTLPVAGDYLTTRPESSSSHPIVSVPSSPPSG
ncbi:hypothetical protein ACOSQ3_028750 [Xanthoceras sorbifolium]